MSHDLGRVTYVTNAKTVMRMLQDDPTKYFQFRIENEGGTGDVRITDGAKLTLYARAPFGVVGQSPVVVESVTDTQFTFRTREGHFDGPNALISFRTFEEGGKVYLEQSAWAPQGAPINAFFAKSNIGHMGWPEQAANLRAAIMSVDPFFQTQPIR